MLYVINIHKLTRILSFKSVFEINISCKWPLQLLVLSYQWYVLVQECITVYQLLYWMTGYSEGNTNCFINHLTNMVAGLLIFPKKKCDSLHNITVIQHARFILKFDQTYLKCYCGIPFSPYTLSDQLGEFTALKLLWKCLLIPACVL